MREGIESKIWFQLSYQLQRSELSSLLSNLERYEKGNEVVSARFKMGDWKR